MPRILVIDDNPDHLEILRVELGRTYEVLTAPDALDGYALAVTGGIDIIVLDIVMPMVDGWTMIMKLRANERTRHIPIIILTALDLEVVRGDARRLDINTVLRKPISDLKGIGHEIAKLLAGSHL